MKKIIRFKKNFDIIFLCNAKINAKFIDITVLNLLKALKLRKI